MPLYNSATTAAALGLSPKWLDNLLSHNDIEGVQQGGQGVQRRLSLDAIAVIATTHAIVSEMKIPVPHAIALAEKLLSDPDGSLQIGRFLVLNLNTKELKDSILNQLSHAVEFTPHPTRGRPPRSGTGTN